MWHLKQIESDPKPICKPDVDIKASNENEDVMIIDQAEVVVTYQNAERSSSPKTSEKDFALGEGVELLVTL